MTRRHVTPTPPPTARLTRRVRLSDVVSLGEEGSDAVGGLEGRDAHDSALEASEGDGEGFALGGSSAAALLGATLALGANAHLLVELERALGDDAILFLPRAELRETELGLGVERFALNAEDGVGGGFARGGDDAGASSRPDAARRASAARYRRHLHFFAGGATGGDHGATSGRRDARSRRVRDSRGRESARGPSAREHHRSDRAARAGSRGPCTSRKGQKAIFSFKKRIQVTAPLSDLQLFVSRASVEVTSRDDSPPSRPGDECDSPGYRDARHFRARARDEHVRRVRSLCRGSRLPTHARALRSAEMRGPARPVPRGIPAERHALARAFAPGRRPVVRDKSPRRAVTPHAPISPRGRSPIARRTSLHSARRTHPTRACAAPRTHPTVPARHARQPPRRGYSSPKECSSSRITSGSPRIPSDHTSRLRESERVTVYARETTGSVRGAHSRSARDARRLHWTSEARTGARALRLLWTSEIWTKSTSKTPERGAVSGLSMRLRLRRRRRRRAFHSHLFGERPRR